MLPNRREAIVLIWKRLYFWIFWKGFISIHVKVRHEALRQKTDYRAGLEIGCLSDLIWKNVAPRASARGAEFEWTSHHTELAFSHPRLYDLHPRQFFVVDACNRPFFSLRRLLRVFYFSASMYRLWWVLFPINANFIYFVKGDAWKHQTNELPYRPYFLFQMFRFYLWEDLVSPYPTFMPFLSWEFYQDIHPQHSRGSQHPATTPQRSGWWRLQS